MTYSLDIYMLRAVEVGWAKFSLAVGVAVLLKYTRIS